MSEIEFNQWWKDMANAAGTYESAGKYKDRDRVEKEMLLQLSIYRQQQKIILKENNCGI